MRRKMISFDRIERMLGREDPPPRCLAEDTGDREYRRMLQVLARLTEAELTPRQRECVQLYYFRGLKMAEIASLLGIQKSTVSRHLKKARLRLQQMLSYSFDRLAG